MGTVRTGSEGVLICPGVRAGFQGPVEYIVEAPYRQNLTHCSGGSFGQE